MGAGRGVVRRVGLGSALPVSIVAIKGGELAISAGRFNNCQRSVWVRRGRSLLLEVNSSRVSDPPPSD